MHNSNFQFSRAIVKNAENMKLTFFGGAKTVTGANYLLESTRTKILIDCGLMQGGRYIEKENFEKFPYAPEEISAVCVTHAHIDHTGRLPKLVREGFRGEIFSTLPTKDFAEILLVDSEHVMRESADREGLPALYTKDDVLKTSALWRGVEYRSAFRIGDFEIEFFDAGHVLGSSFIKITGPDKKKIVFSGDLGNYSEPMVKDTEQIPETDYVLIESTYGNRVHETKEERKALLEDIVEDSVKAGGTLMIPAFALERTQELLYEMNDLVEHGRIPKIPVFVDSPLAIKLTAVYEKYSRDPKYFDSEALATEKSGDAIFNFPGLKFTMTTAQSKEINDVLPPKVVIAGSGMSNGGRILHHERRHLSDEKSAILFIGYQAKGSLGRLILDGAKQVKMFGELIPVRCRVRAIGGYSAHADQPKLLEWLHPSRTTLKKVFVVQGEEEQALPLAQKIRDRFAVRTTLPEAGEFFDL